MKLSEDQVDELTEAITGLMHHYIPNPNGSDYSCCFCYNSPPDYKSPLKHEDDCQGAKFLRWLGRG